MLEIEWHDQRLTLLPERAIWWPRHNAILLSDPHFGKGAAFRAAGVPVPAATDHDTLARLDRALNNTAATALIIVGDFFHARVGVNDTTLAALADWRAQRTNLSITLIRGNHDVHAGDPPPALAIACTPDDWTLPPFTFRHAPPPRDTTPAQPIVAGHLHPIARLAGRYASGLRAPCFWIGEMVLVLPAFGAFTGGHAVRPRRGERVFLTDGESVVEAPLR